MRNSALAVRVGWYSETAWATVRAAAVDAERFEASHSEWLQMARKALAQLRASGVNAEPFMVDADALLAWCLAHGRANDAGARAEFVSMQGGRVQA